ncbi:hypothetical protein [Lysobacter sp. A03]|uniref:hypothetical protein n=1 Tax=Lysobacter sp. A03 TaxID=1199154 RepID=UPI001F270E79|nr:hypothetical protein [Lysobacter sp. A03]
MKQIVAIGVCLVLLGCAPTTVTSRYVTLDEAKADRLFERGWLPDILPPSTNTIRTENDLDLNLSEGEFSFVPAEAEPLFGKLSPGAPSAIVLQTVSSYRRRGYSAWSYRDEDSTWAFFCQESKGHCEYLMWLR